MTAEPEVLDSREETDIILPELEEVKLSTGQVVQIKPLKARQFFRLLRIVTRGGAKILNQLRWSQLDSPDQFAAQLVAVVVFSIPEAEQETLDFIESMVELPEDPEEQKAVLQELTDPEIEDVVNIIEVIVLREKDDLVSLGKNSRRFGLWRRRRVSCRRT